MESLNIRYPMTGFKRSVRQVVWVFVGLMLAAIIPFAIGDYWTRVLVFLFINVGLACSWNVIGGYTGYASFGHGVFFGVGAFAAAIATVRYGFGLPLAILLGGGAAAAISLLLSPVFKQRGLYFALSTLAVMLVFETICQQWSFTRGLQEHDVGWTVHTNLTLKNFYYIFLSILTIILTSSIFLINSKVGYAIRAIHKDEVLASSLGVNATKYKTIAFAYSAFFPGILGAVFAPFLSFVSVQSVFDMNITLNMILMCIFGGAGTILGPVVGGIALSAIDQLAWGNFLDYHRLINGVLIVAIITLLPSGLVPFVTRKWASRKVSQANGFFVNIGPRAK